MNHLPGFLENHSEILAKGVDRIAVVSVNDHHVMNAWAKHTGAEGKILFLADGAAAFTKAVGMDMEMGAARSALKALLDDCQDGVVTQLNLETGPEPRFRRCHDSRPALNGFGQGSDFGFFLNGAMATRASSSAVHFPGDRHGLDPVPFDLVALVRFIKPLPEFGILDRFFVGCLPAVFFQPYIHLPMPSRT